MQSYQEVLCYTSGATAIATTGSNCLLVNVKNAETIFFISAQSVTVNQL
ncbi:hypothetical protein [Nostoc sp.]